MEDHTLLTLLRTQPSEGIRQAAALYGGIAKAAAIRVLGSDPAVEECVADAFVQLWRHAGRIQPRGGGIRAYIATLARNSALDILRKRKARPPELPLEEDCVAMDCDLETEYARKQNGRIVRECVEALPEPDRSVFLRRYYFGQRVKAVAGDLNLDAKRVENILFRGKKKLEALLLERGINR